MTIQTLAFFMLAFQPASVEPSMEVGRTVLDFESSKPKVLVVMVRQKGGAIGQIVLTLPAGDRAFATTKDLGVYLKSIRKDLDNPNDILVRSDPDLEFASVYEVLAACRAAGFRKCRLSVDSKKPSN